jgi:hypothetical protein
MRPGSRNGGQAKFAAAASLGMTQKKETGTRR